MVTESHRTVRTQNSAKCAMKLKKFTGSSIPFSKYGHTLKMFAASPGNPAARDHDDHGLSHTNTRMHILLFAGTVALSSAADTVNTFSIHTPQRYDGHYGLVLSPDKSAIDTAIHTNTHSTHSAKAFPRARSRKHDETMKHPSTLHSCVHLHVAELPSC